MEKIYKTLKEFGLSDNEVKVYLEAIKHAETSPNQLSKLTKIPRTTVYDTLTDLSLKGLVELKHSQGLQKQQTKIRAANPSKLRDILWQRRQDLTSLEVDIVHVLSELKSTFHQNFSNTDFKFYPGIEGAKQVLNHFVENDTNMQAYEISQPMRMDAIGPEFTNLNVDQGLNTQRENTFKLKELVTLNEWTKHIFTYQIERNPNYLKNREVRFIDNPNFNIQNDIYFKGSYIYIICAHGDEVYGLIINSKVLSTTLISFFQLVWISAAPLTDEIIQSWGENEFFKVEKEL
jgi:hypothetical protein